MSDPLIGRLALIGIGLIGSSLARIVKRDGLAGHVVACARRQETLDTVMSLVPGPYVIQVSGERKSGSFWEQQTLEFVFTC